LERRTVIRSNLIQAMRILVEASVEQEVEVECEVSSRERVTGRAWGSTLVMQEERELFGLTYMSDIDGGTSRTDIPPDLARAIAALWADPEIQALYASRSSFQINDSASYFLDRVYTIAADEYVPTPDDVIRSRVRTTGLHEEAIRIGETVFRFCDVGGQRSERRKWVDYFEDVSTIIFVAALSEFDQVLFEARSQNRVHEAEQLFHEIASRAIRPFHNKPIIVFFNKDDLFRDKVARVDIGLVPHPRAGEPQGDTGAVYPDLAFPGYEGGHDIMAARRFFEERFLDHPEVKARRGHVKHKWTTATDRENVRTVFNECKRTIVQANLEGSGFLDEEEDDGLYA
jgi:GTPase SAR1 family protein